MQLQKLNCDNDFQMEINLFGGHFHSETWFKGTRGKGRVSSELTSSTVRGGGDFRNFIFALQILSLL